MSTSLASRSEARGVANHARILLIVSVALTLALYVVPYGRLIGYPLVLISTIVHEMGHGVAAVLVGGHWDSFQMYADGSGVAHVSGSFGHISNAFVAAGGLCGPAVMASFLFAVASRPGVARLTLGALGLALAIVDVWLVRSWFGLAFILALSSISLLIAWKGTAEVAQLLVLFVAVQLSLSVFSRGDYLFTDVAHTDAGVFPSDVANMSAALFLPYWVWGALCAAFSLAMLLFGAWAFLRATQLRAAIAPLK